MKFFIFFFFFVFHLQCIFVLCIYDFPFQNMFFAFEQSLFYGSPTPTCDFDG